MRLAFRLPLDAARLLRARQRIRDYLYQHDVNGAAVDDVVLALEEAMSNAVLHSGSGEDLEVGLWFEEADLITEVRDHGRGFDVNSFDPSKPPDPLKSHGRGLFLISRLMDDLQLRCEAGLEVRAVKRGLLDVQAPSGAAGLAYKAPGAQMHRDLRQRALLDEMPEAYAALDWS